MLGLASGWMEMDRLHANSVAPVLVSRKQGRQKSTFCKMLLPEMLQPYYTDSFDLSNLSGSERRLAEFGLINLDEFDKFSPRKMAVLKNLMQMAGLNIRKAYKKSFSPLPRIASFIATSNQKELLTDPTGSRRFLCVEVEDKIDCSPLEEDMFHACFRPAGESEKGLSLSAAAIFQYLKKCNPSAMRGASAGNFGKILVSLGIERIHTEYGNRYQVVPVDE